MRYVMNILILHLSETPTKWGAPRDSRTIVFRSFAKKMELKFLQYMKYTMHMYYDIFWEVFQGWLAYYFFLNFKFI